MELGLWDTSGQDDYDRLRPISYPDTHVVLMCFSVDHPESLDNIETKWTPELQHFIPKVPRILVCNKIDLRDDKKTELDLTKTNREPLRSEQGRRVANKVGAAAYLECSAKTREGVREVFELATRKTLESSAMNYVKRWLCVVL